MHLLTYWLYLVLADARLFYTYSRQHNFINTKYKTGKFAFCFWNPMPISSPSSTCLPRPGKYKGNTWWACRGDIHRKFISVFGKNNNTSEVEWLTSQSSRRLRVGGELFHCLIPCLGLLLSLHYLCTASHFIFSVHQIFSVILPVCNL